MSSWFTRGFGNVVAEARHELLGGWFGRNFEPHPVHQSPAERSDLGPADRDIHGNDRERGIDR